MELLLTIPDFDDENMTVVETRPNKAERWLNELPLLNVAETSHLVYEALIAMNRMDIDAKTRLKLLEVYRAPVARLCTELKQEYSGKPVPLPDRARLAAQRARNFQIEMTFGYKRLVSEFVESMKNRPSTRAMNTFALILQLAIRYLAETQVKSYQYYAKPPENIWREIHQLYSLADAYGVVDISVNDKLNAAVQESSVGLVYKQALLVDFSDPYHLPIRMVELIQHYLNRWATLAKLGDASSPPSKNCQFLIDLNNDRAGEIIFPSESSKKSDPQYRKIDTTELARVIHAQYTSLQQGQFPDPEGLHEDFFQGEHVQDMLKRLLNSWGIIPKRGFSRTQKKGEFVDVAIGIRAINHWLNGGRAFLLSSDFVGPLPEQRTQIGGMYIDNRENLDAENVAVANANQTVKLDPELIFASWDIIDESAGGLAIANDKVRHQQARVGDLIAVRSHDDDTWEVGGIRWVKTSDVSAVEIGMKRISPIARPVHVKLVGADQIETDFMPAIMVPELAALNQHQGLLTHKGIFRPRREMFYDDGFRLVELRATRLVDTTPSYEHFEYEEIS